MRKIHYRNDFEVDITLTVGGVPIAVPDHDFDIVFISKRGGNQYTCSRKGDNWVNCRAEDGVVKCFLDNHDLALGVLQAEYWDFAPDGDYADGSKQTIVPQNLDIELVKGVGDADTIVDAEVVADLNTAVAEAQEIVAQLEAIEPYTKAEIDEMIGNIETTLADI